MDSVFLKDLALHKDWKPFLSEKILKLTKKIESEVLQDGCYTPSSDKVLRFFEFPLGTAKIIILGQDPYPQPGVATGRAFEVGNLMSWDQPCRNISLKNILRAVYKAYRGEVITYNVLKSEISCGFPVLPPNELFSWWESQGVLLLNTSFTCKPGFPGSHRKVWEGFSRSLLRYINGFIPDVTWFLWGSHAKDITSHLKISQSIVTMHPMMCYDKPGREGDFLYGEKNCFEPFVNIVNWTGYDN